MKIENTAAPRSVAADHKIEAGARKPWAKPVVSSFDVVGETEAFGFNPGDGFANLC